MRTCSEKQVCLAKRVSAAFHSHDVAVQRFATDIVGPKVREMDENEQMDPSIIKGLFEQGVRDPVHPFTSY
jgi:hypothetical protein